MPLRYLNSETRSSDAIELVHLGGAMQIEIAIDGDYLREIGYALKKLGTVQWRCDSNPA